MTVIQHILDIFLNKVSLITNWLTYDECSASSRLDFILFIFVRLDTMKESIMEEVTSTTEVEEKG